MPGFVPVDFSKSGKILIILGLLCLIGKLISYISNWFYLPGYYAYLGVGFVLLGSYLISVVPKE